MSHNREQQYVTCAGAGCGLVKESPSRETDSWFACWCEKPDTCTSCGPCQKCFPGITAEMKDPHQAVLVEEGSLSVQSRL